MPRVANAFPGHMKHMRVCALFFFFILPGFGRMVGDEPEGAGRVRVRQSGYVFYACIDWKETTINETIQELS